MNEKPMAVLSFMIAFTAFGLNGNQGTIQAFGLILGILLGTMCWWLSLTGIAVWFRNRISESIDRWLNRILGSLMMLLGIVMISQSSVSVMSLI